jgi:starvation-inducible outer membrane lipoprotein
MDETRRESLMKATMAAVFATTVLTLAGCSSLPSGGQNLAGFPIDEKCVEFWSNTTMFKGNRALAQATNCSGPVGM